MKYVDMFEVDFASQGNFGITTDSIVIIDHVVYQYNLSERIAGKEFLHKLPMSESLARKYKEYESYSYHANALKKRV